MIAAYPFVCKALIMYLFGFLDLTLKCCGHALLAGMTSCQGRTGVDAFISIAGLNRGR